MAALRDSLAKRTEAKDPRAYKVVMRVAIGIMIITVAICGIVLKVLLDHYLHVAPK